MYVAIAIGLAIGISAGVLSGLVGIGGGVVIVPALLLLGLTQKEATGTSLAALLLPVGALGFLEYYKRHEVRLDYASGIAVGLLIGALAGATIAGHLSNQTLTRIFGILLLVLAVKLLVFT